MSNSIQDLRNHALKDLENCKDEDENIKHDYVEYQYFDKYEEDINNGWSIVEIDGKTVILDERILLRRRKQ